MSDFSYWVVECRDSDGNDCTVLDFIVQAEDADKALSKVMDECMNRVPTADEDGGWGAFYACDCDLPTDQDELDCWECSHGGFLLSETPEGPFATEAEALDASPVYHSSEVI